MLIIEIVVGIVGAFMILGAIGNVVSGSSIPDNSHWRTSGPPAECGCTLCWMKRPPAPPYPYDVRPRR